MNLSDISGINPEIRSFEPSDIFPSNDFIGLEIELEGFHHLGHHSLESKFWRVTEDPSLRDDGREFVFAMPLNGKDVEVALNEFDAFAAWYEDQHNPISCSDRTSIHVHLDVRDFSVEQLLNLSLIFMTFEYSLFKIFGKDREDSNYCLPLSKSTDRFKLSKLVKPGNHDILAALRCSKYSAFNTAPVQTQGSVEFRMHVGTKDVEAIMNWISVVLYMKKFARNMDWDVLQYPGKVSEMGVNNFITSVFEDRAEQFIYPGFQQDLWEGVRIAQDTVIRLDLERQHKSRIDSGDKVNESMKNFIDKHELSSKKPKPRDPIPHNALEALKYSAGVTNVDYEFQMTNPFGLEI